MVGSSDDLWTEWLRHRRYSTESGDQRQSDMLRRFRSTVLDGAALRSDDVVLDVGAGDGLIGFGALSHLDPTGTVIFNDISDDRLSEARTIATELGLHEQCRFLRVPAQELALASESVDAVTARSVLIYLDDADKGRAMSEFYRVLRPGGRLSVLEPVHMFWADLDIDRNTCLGYDAEPIIDIAAKVNGSLGADHDVWIDFDAVDLFELALETGFRDIDVNLTARRRVVTRSDDWDTLLTSTPQPLSRPLEDAIDEALTPDERRRFTEHLRPLVESESEHRVVHEAMAALTAVKA